MEEEEAKIVARMAQIRADTTAMLTWKIVEASGLTPQENVRISTEIGSGRIVIERMKEAEGKN